MENELKNSSKSFLSEKFVWLEFLAESFSIFYSLISKGTFMGF